MDGWTLLPYMPSLCSKNALHVKIVVFWVVTLCTLVSRYQHFGGSMFL
jgi:hypothetical protein